MKVLFRNNTLLAIIWALLLVPHQAHAWGKCSRVAKKTFEKIRKEKAFSSYEEFQRFEAKALALIKHGRDGKTWEQILADPKFTMESILPREALGRAAFYQVFSNYGNGTRTNTNIEIGKMLTGQVPIPPGAERSVRKLKEFLMSNKILTIKFNTKGQMIIPKKKNRKWFNQMRRWATLTATIHQYTRLEKVYFKAGGETSRTGVRGFLTRRVANRFGEGFVRFLQTRTGAEIQRKLFEKQLIRSNFAESLQLMGLYNKKAMTVRFKSGVEKYSNLMGNLANAALFGGVIVGANVGLGYFGIPINLFSIIGPAWLATGFIPMHYRYKAPISSKKTQEILNAIRYKGYEKGIAPYRTSLFVTRNTQRASKFLQAAFMIGMMGFLAYFLNEYGETIYDGATFALMVKGILEDPEGMSLSEGAQSNEQIRKNLYEAKCLEFPLVFDKEYEDDPYGYDIHPENDYEWTRYLRSVTFCTEKVLKEMHDFVCSTKASPVQGYDEQEVFIQNKYGKAIEDLDLNPDLVRLCAEQVFWLWQDADVDRDIRYFSQQASEDALTEGVKDQIKDDNHCGSRGYFPTVFKTTNFMERLNEKLFPPDD